MTNDDKYEQSVRNDWLITVLHELVDNLKPVLTQLSDKTVPLMRIVLEESSGRKLVLTAGIEFEHPATEKSFQVPLHRTSEPPAETTHTESESTPATIGEAGLAELSQIEIRNLLE